MAIWQEPEETHERHECSCDECLCDHALDDAMEEVAKGDCVTCGGLDATLSQVEHERNICDDRGCPNNVSCCECNPQMHDSGKREEFGTGAVRDDASGKVRPDLFSPFAMERIGEWLRLGALKYSERNWERGIKISRCIASLERHLLAYKQGRCDEDHLAAIAVNASFIMHYEEMIKLSNLDESLSDMPDYLRNVTCQEH